VKAFPELLKYQEEHPQLLFGNKDCI